MAESRTLNIGTVFSRIKGLIQGGAMKYEERPVWFDVYRAFPPEEEPLSSKPVRTTVVRDIFYPEDAVRAFVRKYIELSNDRSVSKSDLTERARAELEQEGLYLVTHEEYASKAAQQRQRHLHELNERQQREQNEEEALTNAGEKSLNNDVEEDSDASNVKASSGPENFASNDAGQERTETARAEKTRQSLDENHNDILPSLGRK